MTIKISFVSASAALAAGLMLLDAVALSTTAEARGRGGGGGGLSMRSVKIAPKPQMTLRPKVQPRVLQSRTVLKLNKKLVTTGTTRTVLTKKMGNKLPIKALGSGQAGLQTMMLRRKMPTFAAASGKANLKGRIGLPGNIQPRLTLVKGPLMNFKPRLSPFVQRHWKHAFFWVAVAGIGYVTVPELYYERFLGYVSIDDPDYDAAIALLSRAAIEEDEIVRVKMPTQAAYRYTARAAPKAEARAACSLEPFVERQWNRSFVWVQVPEVGNVTVPESDYDRFYGLVSAAPPNYSTACAILTEAAAADTIVAAAQTATGETN